MNRPITIRPRPSFRSHSRTTLPAPRPAPPEPPIVRTGQGDYERSMGAAEADAAVISLWWMMACIMFFSGLAAGILIFG